MLRSESILRLHRAALRVALGQYRAASALVELATDELASGSQSPSLVALASLSNPSFADVTEMLPMMESEFGWDLSSSPRTLAADLSSLYPVVEDALGQMLQDLAATGGPHFTVEIGEEDDSRNLQVVLRDDQGTGTGFTFNLDHDESVVRALAIECLRDAAIESSHGTWPPCSRHPGEHPLFLSAGYWVCPRDHLAIAPLGALGQRR